MSISAEELIEGGQVEVGGSRTANQILEDSARGSLIRTLRQAQIDSTSDYLDTNNYHEVQISENENSQILKVKSLSPLRPEIISVAEFSNIFKYEPSRPGEYLLSPVGVLFNRKVQLTNLRVETIKNYVDNLSNENVVSYEKAYNSFLAIKNQASFTIDNLKLAYLFIKSAIITPDFSKFLATYGLAELSNFSQRAARFNVKLRNNSQHAIITKSLITRPNRMGYSDVGQINPTTSQHSVLFYLTNACLLQKAATGHPGKHPGLNPENWDPLNLYFQYICDLNYMIYSGTFWSGYQQTRSTANTPSWASRDVKLRDTKTGAYLNIDVGEPWINLTTPGRRNGRGVHSIHFAPFIAAVQASREISGGLVLSKLINEEDDPIDEQLLETIEKYTEPGWLSLENSTYTLSDKIFGYDPHRTDKTNRILNNYDGSSPFYEKLTSIFSKVVPGNGMLGSAILTNYPFEYSDPISLVSSTETIAAKQSLEAKSRLGIQNNNKIVEDCIKSDEIDFSDYVEKYSNLRNTIQDFSSIYSKLLRLERDGNQHAPFMNVSLPLTLNSVAHKIFKYLDVRTVWALGNLADKSGMTGDKYSSDPELYTSYVPSADNVAEKTLVAQALYLFSSNKEFCDGLFLALCEDYESGYLTFSEDSFDTSFGDGKILTSNLNKKPFTGEDVDLCTNGSTAVSKWINANSQKVMNSFVKNTGHSMGGGGFVYGAETKYDISATASREWEPTYQKYKNVGYGARYYTLQLDKTALVPLFRQSNTYSYAYAQFKIPHTYEWSEKWFSKLKFARIWFSGESSRNYRSDMGRFGWSTNEHFNLESAVKTFGGSFGNKPPLSLYRISLYILSTYIRVLKDYMQCADGTSIPELSPSEPADQSKWPLKEAMDVSDYKNYIKFHSENNTDPAIKGSHWPYIADPKINIDHNPWSNGKSGMINNIGIGTDSWLPVLHKYLLTFRKNPQSYRDSKSLFFGRKLKYSIRNITDVLYHHSQVIFKETLGVAFKVFQYNRGTVPTVGIKVNNKTARIDIYEFFRQATYILTDDDELDGSGISWNNFIKYIKGQEISAAARGRMNALKQALDIQSISGYKPGSYEINIAIVPCLLEGKYPLRWKIEPATNVKIQSARDEINTLKNDIHWEGLLAQHMLDADDRDDVEKVLRWRTELRLCQAWCHVLPLHVGPGTIVDRIPRVVDGTSRVTSYEARKDQFPLISMMLSYPKVMNYLHENPRRTNLLAESSLGLLLDDDSPFYKVKDLMKDYVYYNHRTPVRNEMQKFANLDEAILVGIGKLYAIADILWSGDVYYPPSEAKLNFLVNVYDAVFNRSNGLYYPHGIDKIINFYKQQIKLFLAEDEFIAIGLEALGKYQKNLIDPVLNFKGLTGTDRGESIKNTLQEFSQRNTDNKVLENLSNRQIVLMEKSTKTILGNKENSFIPTGTFVSSNISKAIRLMFKAMHSRYHRPPSYSNTARFGRRRVVNNEFNLNAAKVFSIGIPRNSYEDLLYDQRLTLNTLNSTSTYSWRAGKSIINISANPQSISHPDFIFRNIDYLFDLDLFVLDEDIDSLNFDEILTFDMLLNELSWTRMKYDVYNDRAKTKLLELSEKETMLESEEFGAANWSTGIFIDRKIKENTLISFLLEKYYQATSNIQMNEDVFSMYDKKDSIEIDEVAADFAAKTKDFVEGLNPDLAETNLLDIVNNSVSKYIPDSLSGEISEADFQSVEVFKNICETSLVSGTSDYQKITSSRFFDRIFHVLFTPTTMAVDQARMITLMAEQGGFEHAQAAQAIEELCDLYVRNGYLEHIDLIKQVSPTSTVGVNSYTLPQKYFTCSTENAQRYFNFNKVFFSIKPAEFDTNRLNETLSQDVTGGN